MHILTGMLNNDTSTTNSNSNLTSIINKTGRSFNWGKIINTSTGYNFVTGTVVNEYGNVSITSE